MEDLKRSDPERLKSVVHFFRFVKTFDGKPENTFLYNAEFLEREKALEVINECHEMYESLLKADETQPDLAETKRKFHL